jgi:hypothetical protein
VFQGCSNQTCQFSQSQPLVPRFPAINNGEKYPWLIQQSADIRCDDTNRINVFYLFGNAHMAKGYAHPAVERAPAQPAAPATNQLSVTKPEIQATLRVNVLGLLFFNGSIFLYH